MVLIAADPGLHGALAFYDTRTGQMEIADMPVTRKDREGKAAKPVIDQVELLATMQVFVGMGATHFIVEEVGGMPGQGASHSFHFGFGAGLLRMAAVASGLIIEPVSPQRWKAAMKVSTTPAAIRARASEVIPTHAHLWALGKFKPNSDVGLGRAEAALLAAYGERFLRGPSHAVQRSYYV